MKSRLSDAIAFVLFLLIVTAAKGQAATVIYAATQNGPYKSADGGLTWKPITVNPGNSFLQGVPNLGAIAVDPQNPSTVYFAGAFNGGASGFCKSTDAAQSWSCVTLIGFTVVTSSGTTQIAIDPVFTNVIYLASTGYNVMRSTDGGTTWSNAGVVTSYGITDVITDPRWSGLVYAATADPIYKSNSFGTSWVVSSQRLIPTGLTPSIHGLFLDPQFGNTIFAAASGACVFSSLSQQCGLFRSEDGGLSWTNLGLPGAFSSVAFDSATGDYYAGGDITGPGSVVLKSSDGGFTFSPIKNGFGGGAYGPLVYTDPSAGSTVYAIGSISGVYLRSTDRGVTWTSMSFPRDCTGMGCSSAPVVVSRLAFAVTPSSASLSNLSNASFKGGPLAPESMVAAFGSNLATGSASSNSDPLPTSLLGTTVSVMDSAGTARQAPLFYVSAPQVIYEVPPGTALG